MISTTSAMFCLLSGVVGTTRFCSSRDMGNQCQYIRYPDHDRVYRACIYTCSGDGCNGASSMQISTLTLAFTAVALMYGLLAKR